MKTDFTEFEKAYKAIQDYIDPSPMIKNEWLSKRFKCNVYLKLESLLPVGSFKLRGATYKMLQLNEEQRKKGVLAASAGNHAQGVAWAAQKLGISALIIMPKGSPLTKILNTQELGAEVILHGESIEECFQHAEKMEAETGRIFIHPFFDENVIAGQGSVGFECVNQVEKIDYLVGAVGGGGLMSGIGSVMKKLSPDTTVIATQASGSSSMIQSLQKGELTCTNEAHTFADGIRVKTPNNEIFDILNNVVDEAVHVDDDRIALSLLALMEHARIITEGAGALPLAAFDHLYKQNPKRFNKKNIVLIICGGNIDINVIDRIIEKGLNESKRRATIHVPLPDSPGSLKDLTALFFETGVNILQAVHDREAPDLSLQESIVKVTIETKGEDHLHEVLERLNKDYVGVKVI